MSRLLVNHASFVRAIPAGCWIKPLPCLPGPVGEFVAGSQGARVLGALDPLADGQQRGELVAAPAASPASPVQRARLERMIRVSGCSGPWTRSRTGSSAASWSRTPAASPASLLSRGDAEAVGDFAQAQLLAAQVEGEHGVVGDGRASDCLGLRDMFSILTAAVALPVGFADGWRCIAARWAWRAAWRNWQGYGQDKHETHSGPPFCEPKLGGRGDAGRTVLTGGVPALTGGVPARSVMIPALPAESGRPGGVTGQQTPSCSRPRSRRAARPAATGHGPVTGNASARCVHPRLLCRVSCSGRARPMTARAGRAVMSQQPPWSEQDPGQFRPQPPGTPPRSPPGPVTS